MKGCIRLLFLTLAWSHSVGSIPAHQVGRIQPCMTCEELLTLRLPGVRIDSAIEVREAAKSGDQAYCRVVGVISKEIGFELLLPAQWNKRFVMGGGGGFVGYMMNRARNRVYDGYATVGTDTGHEGTDAKWALNNIERQLNFGHLAVHRTAETAKAIIFYFYGSDPEYSYFIGLSRGGGQAMMEAQRYPEDFDGIVAGAPAFNWVGQAAEFIQNACAIYPDITKKPVISKDNLRLLQKLIFQRCDGKDGIRDGILNDPRECDFDLKSIRLCPGEEGGLDCFTKAQVEAVKVIYDGVGNGEKQMHPGFPYGGEDDPTGWFPSIVGPNKGAAPYFSRQAFFGMETFRYLIFNDPDWHCSDYNFDGIYNQTRFASAYLDAIQTDYSGFKNNGGKMIIYQGWIDPLISALDIINHYEQAQKLDPGIQEHIRLFMLPGITHTGGSGPGKADWFQLICDWVEKDLSPERVVVSKYSNGQVIMSRPVFPYPRKAIYDGKGDPNKESSFK